MFRKLISFSEELEELDLRYNLIGDLGGKEVVEGLKIRNRGNNSYMEVGAVVTTILSSIVSKSLFQKGKCPGANFRTSAPQAGTE